MNITKSKTKTTLEVPRYYVFFNMLELEGKFSAKNIYPTKNVGRVFELYMGLNLKTLVELPLPRPGKLEVEFLNSEELSPIKSSPCCTTCPAAPAGKELTPLDSSAP